MDYNYEMVNLYGDVCTIYGTDGGPAFADYYDFESGTDETRKFSSEYRAYSWAYMQGFRD